MLNIFCSQFNTTNKIDLIARAHQLVMEGYKLMFNDTLVTVWSAPNYCYRCGNVAAILELDEHLNKNFKIFEAAPQVTHYFSLHFTQLHIASSDLSVANMLFRNLEVFLPNSQLQTISCNCTICHTPLYLIQ